jgi:hypothetical protein
VCSNYGVEVKALAKQHNVLAQIPGEKKRPNVIEKRLNFFPPGKGKREKESLELKKQTYNVSRRGLTINVFLHDTILENTDSRKNIESVLVARLYSVENETDHNLLPSWTSLVPELGLFEVDDITNVLHDTVECTSSQDLVLRVVGDCDEKLGVTVVHGLTEIVTILQGKVVGIASSSSV